MERFRSSTTLPAAVEEAFAWHERQGAFERLAPPWDYVEVKEKKGRGVQDGATLDLRIGNRFTPIRWLLEHFGYEKNKAFNDRQLRGPFKRWEHYRRFSPSTDGGRSLLEDEILYELPGGIAGQAANRLAVEPRLRRAFQYRAEVLTEDLRRHAGVSPRTFLITGGTGLVGRCLSSFLSSGGHEVVVVSRSGKAHGYRALLWDGIHPFTIPSDLKIDAAVHLAGENIANGRWTPEKKQRIRESRVEGTKAFCAALCAANHRPAVLISASGVGYYGNRGDELLTEEAGRGRGFLAEVAEGWEQGCRGAIDAGIRTVNLRIGMVLTPAGGALEKMLLPFKAGAGTTFGDGKQYQSWIAIDDLVYAIYFCALNQGISGPVNTCAPSAVTNKEFSAQLAKILKRPLFFSAPKGILEAVFGELAREVLFSSARAAPEKLGKAGFNFAYPGLLPALSHLLGATA